MISPHNIGVIFAVIALVVLSAMCILWHYIIRKPYETIVKNTATTARAQARYTPVRYVDGTKKNVVMCNSSDICHTISPFMQCEDSGLDWSGCDHIQSESDCSGVCAWNDEECSLHDSYITNSLANACASSSASKCKDSSHCLWDSKNTMCSLNSKPLCGGACSWSTCTDYTSEFECSKTGCNWSDGKCMFRGEDNEVCSNVAKFNTCDHDDIGCQYTRCRENGCIWNTACRNVKGKSMCYKNGIQLKDSSGNAMKCSTVADCGSFECTDPGNCGMCKKRFCGSLETHGFSISGALDDRINGEFAISDNKATSPNLDNGKVILKRIPSNMNWGMYSKTDESELLYKTSNHALTQRSEQWASVNSSLPNGMSGAIIASSMCSSFGIPSTCNQDVSCIWNYDTEICVSKTSAIHKPWCTLCEKSPYCAPGGVCMNSPKGCAANDPLVPGVCPDLLTPCTNGTDCYRCDKNMCPDQMTPCSTSSDCMAAQCSASNTHTWDGSSCIDETCWGECRSSPPSITTADSRSCDHRLSEQFVSRIGELLTDSKYATKNTSGRWVPKSRSLFNKACQVACDDCPSELKDACGGCDFRSTAGVNCLDACQSTVS